MRSINPIMASLAIPLMFGFDTEGGAEGGAPATSTNTYAFPIPGVKNEAGEAVLLSLDLEAIKPDVRLDMLKQALRGYVNNSVNQAALRNKTALAPWTAYEAAMSADPTQTVVAKPEGERPSVDLIAVAVEARKRLYEGTVRKQGTGGTAKVKADPVETAITTAVTREVYDKEHAANSEYKWTDAVKAVAAAGSGRKYLEARISEKVANGAAEADLRKYMDERFVKPAEMMYGKRDSKATKDTSLL